VAAWAVRSWVSLVIESQPLNGASRSPHGRAP
jgi:hypothetical protein